MSAIPRNIPGNLRAALLISVLLLVAPAAQAQTPVFPTETFTLQVGVLVSTLATGDFNGDGQPDLAYLSVPGSGTPSPTLTVLLNQGAPISLHYNQFADRLLALFTALFVGCGRHEQRQQARPGAHLSHRIRCGFDRQRRR